MFWLGRGSSGSKNKLACVRRLLVVALVLAAMVSTGECIRGTREFFKGTLDSQLPRGPVPPSGPSLCHNKLSPFDRKELSFTNDYSMCP
ncbi:Transmembrane protein [Quillaja saponaria]|uniref:Transmembrane protein n=1 Tax=Quillaja saponaria TaxID=32244 RepID=A0AAD7L9T3_QUISA|nr:Transmembrane protein [Quillaja saponaria]